MTTEHVSVSRELFDMAREQIERQRLAALEYGLIAVAEAHSYALHKIDAILSRATPSDELSNRITVLEDDCDQLMKERDAAEAAISDMFEKVTGRPAEWSNLWGYAEAVEEAEEHVAQLEDKVKSQSMTANVSGEHGLYIQWSDAPDWANWFAADFFTQCWWYENKPVAGGNQWIPDGGKTMRASSRTEWKETLQQRPTLLATSPIAPRVVTDELVQLVADDLDGIFAIEDIQEQAFLTDVRRIVQRIADELATSLPAAIPSGYVLVPIEPTKAMCDAYMQTDDEADHSAGPREVVARDIYKAMLSAAPQAGERG